MAVVCATVLAACGSSATPPANPDALSVGVQVPGDGASGDAAAVGAAVTGFMTAFAAGDGQKACSLMGDAAVAGVVQDGADRTVDEAFALCADTVKTLGELMDDADREQLRNVKLSDVTVDGDSASAKISYGGETVELERSDEGWRLSDSPVS